MDTIIIQQSLDHLPPPYSYQYKIEINFSPKFEVEFTINYLDRDEISTEEIEAEGFSENDDFQWKGELPQVWKDTMMSLPDKLKDKKKNSNCDITIIEGDKSVEKQPINDAPFDYFVQEIIQAIYEKNGKQDELKLVFKDINSNQSETHHLTISFYNRQATFDDGKIDWEAAQEAIKKVFSFDYDDFNALQKEPVKKGFYVSTDASVWYRADSSIKNFDGSSVTNALRKLVRELEI